ARPLPSFPTRRSSDLSALELLASVRPDPAAPVEELLEHDAARATELIVVTSRLPRALVHKLLERRGGALVYVDAAGAREPELLRSEEHTSELQSPYDL